LLDQNEFDTALVARSRRLGESVCGTLIGSELPFEDDVRIEKRLVLFERVVDMPGRDVEEFVFE
jgi:hypothetical protein